MEELNEKITLVALGDSITYGYPFTPKYSWVEYVRKRTNWQAINAGIPGDTFYEMLRRVQDDVLAYKPSIVIVMGGTNDVMQGYSQSQIQQNFIQLLDEIRKIESEIVIGIPLPVLDSTAGVLQVWRQFLKEYGRKHNIQSIDFYSGFIEDTGDIKEELLLDNCHPCKKGYEVMGKIALQSLVSSC